MLRPSALVVRCVNPTNLHLACTLHPASHVLRPHRKAFADLYAGRAGELAEQMGRLRVKEAAKRDRFKRAVERYIPAPVLAAMGLLAPPPHCQVTVAPQEAGLLPVTMDDLRRVPADAQVHSLTLHREPFEFKSSFISYVEPCYGLRGFFWCVQIRFLIVFAGLGLCINVWVCGGRWSGKGGGAKFHAICYRIKAILKLVPF